MRSACFLTISLALHLTVLVYFGVGDKRHSLAPIAVTILPIEADVDQENSPTGNGNSRARNGNPEIRKIVTQTVPLEQRPFENEKVNEALTHPSPVEVRAKSAETSVVHAVANTVKEISPTPIGSGSTNGHGNGDGISGNGAANGVGQRVAARAAITAPARYSNTPKPAYPDSARREGREGRVLLRVLIDEQGETKTVEVSRSSGSDALDRAAASVIRRWRFHPARSGEQAIESWVTVPIDFRLDDTRD
jgi:protein TonB